MLLCEITKEILTERLQTLKDLRENLILGDTRKIRKYLMKVFTHLIQTGYIRSYHKQLTSGDMNPMDFIEDLTDKVINDLESQIQKINDRGDKYIQQGVEKPPVGGIVSGKM